MTDQAPTSQTLRTALQAPTLRPLFEELGWDNPQGGPLSEEVDGQVFTFTPVARKINFVVYRASSPGGQLPGKDTIRKLERKLEAKAAERLVVYSDSAGERALWVRHKKEQGKAASLYTVEYKRGLRNEALVYYLKSLYVSLEEDLDGLTTIDVARKASNIEVEKVTKKFYKEFDRIRKAFVDQISGVKGNDQEHYAGLTLNRLMFVYFIQKKEYLDGDPDYLRNRLKKVQAQRGSGKFQSFYRAFLLRLFHEGLGAVPHDAGLTALIGKVPYLNGGLFEEHRIEQENEAIEIPDAAFEKVFAFFEGWRWTIDESAEAEADEAGKPEINPDVLGYIFEQYINNRSKMGAYYTKQDITEYISKNTILPFVLERTYEDCRVAFEGEHTVWELLKNDPDRYIHAAVRKGSEYELPEHIQAGLDPDQPELLEKRKAWNKKADVEYALPTEIWREVVARRTRYSEVRGKLERGEVRSVPELITLNLDIITFAQDVIRYAEGPELIRAIWKAITTVTVLDPTCGSGAFLFAAAGILEPLYRLCLERMTEMVAALPENDTGLPVFQEALAEQAQHDPQYYILKQIIIRNLYGVDIMAEAVEIAKLRLFLKLMAFSQKNEHKLNMGLEPLPDIDFNIRAGNTLVGYATREEAEKAVRGRLLGTSGITWEQIEEKAEDVDRLEARFREQQLKHGGQGKPTDKQELRDRLGELEALLNGYLAADYGIDEKKSPGSFAEWRESHQPFHWFIEFHNVMNRGGFDCIVGNPPYLEESQVDYEVINYRSKETKAVHAWCIERSSVINHRDGSNGMIVPLSIVSTQRMKIIQDILEKNHSIWYSNYSWRPAKLFDTVNRALTIFISSNKPGRAYTTQYQKWNSESRDALLERVYYVESPVRKEFWLPKLGEEIELSIINKLLSVHDTINSHTGVENSRLYYRTDGGLYWKVFTDFAPRFVINGVEGSSSRETWLSISSASETSPLIGLLSSNLFWWWYTVTSNCRHLNPYDVKRMPVAPGLLADGKFGKISDVYIREIKLNSTMLTRMQKQTGNTQTQSFKISKSKDTVDALDVYLSRYYGLTMQEMDFIINYDIKYRMGADAEGED